MQKAIIGKKIGMTRIFDADGKVIPVTVIEAGPCSVTQIKSEENDGYNAVQFGFADVQEKKLNKPQLGHLKKAGVALRAVWLGMMMFGFRVYSLSSPFSLSLPPPSLPPKRVQ